MNKKPQYGSAHDVCTGAGAFVSDVDGGPSLPYSHSSKKVVITRGEKHDMHSTPIIVKSKINAQDITKYFKYSHEANQCGHDVTDLQSIVNGTMGSNFSRHHGKGLTGRRTQSSSDLCDPQGKLSDVRKMFVPCSNSSEQRYNISGSLPNNLDSDNQPDHMDDLLANNNIVSGTIVKNTRDTLTDTKPYRQVKFYDRSTIGMELVKYHSHDSLKGDPWKYQHNSARDAVRCQHEMAAFRQGSKTLPVRRIDPKWCDPRSIRTVHQNHSMQIVGSHQSDSQLLMHRHRERLAVAHSRPLIAREHHNQDQGYASERSPEDEHPPLLPGQSIIGMDSGCIFRIILQKSNRGLGLSVSGGGTAGPVRVKRLFPQQPAALSNQLKPGDILLAANDIPLSGLTNYEALEVLRTTSSIVELLVCRPVGETSVTPPGDPPTPPARRKTSSTQRCLNPIPPLHIEPCGEFDIEMTKVDGSLGFTLRKVDSSALGHYIRALVREPALSDGRIQPGDKIVAVDDTRLSPMSHEEAVSLLRQCGSKVKLRLYRDLAQTPVSALSPTEPDHPLRPSHTSLRQEAVDMLCDLAVRKLSPTGSNGSACQYQAGISTTSPRRLRKPLSRTYTADKNGEESTDTFVQICKETSSNDLQTDENVIPRQEPQSETKIPLSPHSSDTIKPSRPRSLHLSSLPSKIEFSSDCASNSEDMKSEQGIMNTITAVDITTTTTLTLVPNVQTSGHQYRYHSINLSVGNSDNNSLSFEPTSMPPLISSLNSNNVVALSHPKPVYRSAKQTSTRKGSGEDLNCARGQSGSFSSDHGIPAKITCGLEETAGTKGLLKWKGVMFESNAKSNSKIHVEALENGQYNEKINETEQHAWHDCEVFMVELTRGWNSRLGFSLQSRDNSTIISMVHPDSVAAKDGRLKKGDILIKVNDENVENSLTSDIIDLLRRIRGSIGITVARRKIRKLDT